MKGLRRKTDMRKIMQQLLLASFMLLSLIETTEAKVYLPDFTELVEKA